MAVKTLSAVMAEIKSNPGKVYVYVLRHPDGAPFYVGLGTKRRIRFHERAAGSATQSAKLAIIREIMTSGAQVGYEITGWFDDMPSAAIEERRLIALYGRADHGDGPLTNRTNGGQGISGPEWYTPARLAGAKKAAKKNRGRNLSEEHKAKIGAGHKGRKQSAEWIEKRAAVHRGKRQSEEHRAKLSVVKKGKPNTGRIGKHHSPEARAKMSAARKGQPPPAAALIAGAAWRAANEEQISAKRKALWADPAYREMMLSPEKKAARAAALRRPETRERLRASGKAAWKDDAKREAILAGRRK